MNARSPGARTRVEESESDSVCLQLVYRGSVSQNSRNEMKA